jgi:AAHS family 4-hydroxybenzoate transporter-like MFS transporter
VLTARLADRFGPPRVAAICFALGAVCVGGIGVAQESVGMLMGLCFLTGLFNNGTTFIGNVIATSVYPTAMRTTGVGWSYGMWRLGSIIGPFLAGLMLAAHWALPDVFLLTAMADAIAALSATALVFAARDALHHLRFWTSMSSTSPSQSTERPR